LVSHDRAFIDNVVTGVLAFNGDGQIDEFVGGYTDWQRQRPETPAASKAPPGPARTPDDKPVAAVAQRKAVKLSYKDQRELDALPERIETLEAEQAEHQATVNAPDAYQQNPEGWQQAADRLEAIELELLDCLDRWEILEARQRGDT